MFTRVTESSLEEGLLYFTLADFVTASLTLRMHSYAFVFYQGRVSIVSLSNTEFVAHCPFYMNMDFYCCAEESPQLDPIMSQFNLVYILTFCILSPPRLILSAHLCLCLASGLLV
jgi:hypothetical protein